MVISKTQNGTFDGSTMHHGCYGQLWPVSHLKTCCISYYSNTGLRLFQFKAPLYLNDRFSWLFLGLTRVRFWRVWPLVWYSCLSVTLLNVSARYYGTSPFLHLYTIKHILWKFNQSLMFSHLNSESLLGFLYWTYPTVPKMCDQKWTSNTLLETPTICNIITGSVVVY